MKLLNSQKNQLHSFITESGNFSVNQFELVENFFSGNFGTCINFKGSNYSFLFLQNGNRNECFVRYCPGYDVYVEQTTREMSFDETHVYFLDWLDNLKREIDSPDLWTKFEAEINNLEISSTFDNSPFTVTEYNDLSLKINQLIKDLSTLELLKHQQTEIQLNLERLLEMAEKSGKFDWKNLFIGTIMSIIIQLSVTPENAKALWMLIKGIFSNYFLNNASR